MGSRSVIDTTSDLLFGSSVKKDIYFKVRAAGVVRLMVNGMVQKLNVLVSI